MARVNFHIHSTGSDGKVSPEEIIQKSIEAGLTHICFTDHYPRPTNDEWTRKFHPKEYIEEIKKLKEKYKDKIDISFGAEFDWYEEYKDKIRQSINKEGFDFVLGSIHFLKMKNGEFGFIYYNKELFEELIKEFGSIENLVKEYYKQIRSLTNSRLFDCVAHLELIKAFYENPSFLNEKWYKEEVEKTLDEISKNKMCIEINMSGIRRTVKEPFPSLYVLKEAKKRNVPLVVSSDFHDYMDKGYEVKLDTGIDEAVKIAKEAGYNKISIFKNRKMKEIKI